MLDSEFQSEILDDAMKRHSKTKSSVTRPKILSRHGELMADEVLWRAHIHPDKDVQ